MAAARRSATRSGIPTWASARRVTLSSTGAAVGRIRTRRPQSRPKERLARREETLSPHCDRRPHLAHVARASAVAPPLGTREREVEAETAGSYLNGTVTRPGSRR
jgi:hypothetical protein